MKHFCSVVLSNKSLSQPIEKIFDMNTVANFVRMLLACLFSISLADAAITLSPPFGADMVIQRGKPIPVSGTAAPNKGITVAFDNQTKTTSSDGTGNWRVMLDPMQAKVAGGDLKVSEEGGATVTLSNVVVGDVWICSGQSNMAVALKGCERQQDIDGADFPMLRQFRLPETASDVPLRTAKGKWIICSPSTAAGFSATAFYFGRKICQDQKSTIPIGLYFAAVGQTQIDRWLPQEGLTDIPELAPLFNQSIMPKGPFSLFNGMLYPHVMLPARGMIWYQGEHGELEKQSPDSYYLKMKALSQGVKRMLGQDSLPFYFVQLASFGGAQKDSAPNFKAGIWNADTRLQQANAMSLPNAGMASAMDLGESKAMHPKNKLDVGERLALWALKNEYGSSIAETSGPILKDVTVSGSNLICTFEHAASGLMVGSKEGYEKVQEVPNGNLEKFSITGDGGKWHDAVAKVVGNTVVVSSPSVPTPRGVAYACMSNPTGCNLYNKDGLPASPFYVEDLNAKFNITASTGEGGSITPAGVATYLKRKTALYTITPNAGKFIKDVLVDGISVGAVKHYTFDPLYANHTISAVFTSSAPSYVIKASAAPGCTISPSGSISVAQGSSQCFTITLPPAGGMTVSVDGKPMGQRTIFNFADVRKNHTISVEAAPQTSPQASPQTAPETGP